MINRLSLEEAGQNRAMGKATLRELPRQARARAHTMGRRASEVRWTGFDAMKENIMLIRITCHCKSLERRQMIEYKGINTTSRRNPTGGYMDSKPNLLILCGSV